MHSVTDVIQHDIISSWYACRDWLCLVQLVSQQCSTGNTIEDSCEFSCCLYNPMKIDIKMSLIKYSKHIKSFPNAHILKQSYLENVYLTTICLNKNLWSSCIKATLESNEYGNVWHENHEINLSLWVCNFRVHSD